MEKSLYDAAIEGDATTLYQLLQEDPLVLDKATLNCEDKNPLNIAAVLGNLEFVLTILNVNNSFYCMCLARDRNGRNPLHLAAMHGKLKVLQVLVLSAKQAALENTEGGGTILHLCVKYNQLEALKLLVNMLNDPKFVNEKNKDGMTVLHLAVYYEQNETAKYLLVDTKVKVNSKNENGKTALDLLSGQGGVTKNCEILHSLRQYGALKGKDVSPSPVKDRKLEQLKWFGKSREVVIVVASLIATMAFQAVISPPGGFWQDDPHKIGEAVMAQRHPNYYRHFIRSNTTAFVSSLSTIILLIRGSGIPSKYLMPLLAFIMWLAIATISITYAISLVILAPKDERGQLITNASGIVLIVIMVWSTWMVTTLYELYVQFQKWMKIRRMDSIDLCFNFIGQVVSRVSLRVPQRSGGVSRSSCTPTPSA